MAEYLNPEINSLIKKVHDEGIEKANKEAEKIIAEANQQSDGLLEGARQRTARMQAQAEHEIKHLRENLNSELKAVTQQTMNTIKESLSAAVSRKIISNGIDDAMREKDFLQKIIFTVLKNWKPADENFRLELLVNENDEAQLREFFEQRIKKEFAAEMEIVIENKIRSGFKIAVKNDSYYVSFSGEDFENFFKSYLRKKTLEWIYGTKDNPS